MCRVLAGLLEKYMAGGQGHGPREISERAPDLPTHPLALASGPYI